MKPFFYLKYTLSAKDPVYAVGLGSIALAGMAAGAPLTAAAGAMMLAATALRNTTANPETCLTFDKKEKYCHYKNKCTFPVSATAGRGFNIVEGKGRASCLRDKNGPIPPDRSDVTVKRNPKARDCVVVYKDKTEQNNPKQTIVRNHCNVPVFVTLKNECKDTYHTKIIPKRENATSQINFDCFGEEDIQVNFDTQKTEN